MSMEGGGGLQQGRRLSSTPVRMKSVRTLLALGGTDQLPHGRTQPLGEIPSQNVAEVAGGDGVVDLVAQL